MVLLIDDVDVAGGIGGEAEAVFHLGPALQEFRFRTEPAATLDSDFDDTASAGDVEQSIARLDQEIKQAYPKIKRIFVEAEDRRTI